MTRNHRIIIIAVAIVAVSVSFAGAQIVVTDPATTIKNAAIASYFPFLCTTCGYDLTGNTSGVCPECGERREGREGRLNAEC